MRLPHDLKGALPFQSRYWLHRVRCSPSGLCHKLSAPYSALTPIGPRSSTRDGYSLTGLQLLQSIGSCLPGLPNAHRQSMIWSLWSRGHLGIVCLQKFLAWEVDANAWATIAPSLGGLHLQYIFLILLLVLALAIVASQLVAPLAIVNRPINGTSFKLMP